MLRGLLGDLNKKSTTAKGLLKDKKLCGDKSELKKEIRKLKNGWFQQKACLAEQCAREKNHREFYAILKAIYGSKPRNLHPVKSKSGALLSSAEDIKKRWVEHFNELLNQPTNADWDILGEIKIHPTLEELDAPITMAEVETAINNTKFRKSPGPGGILPEILAHGGSALRSFLFTIFNLLWTTEDLPSDWIDAISVSCSRKRSQSMWKLPRGVSAQCRWKSLCRHSPTVTPVSG
ncbi:uncharacterized protein [Montipora capricornis]|uniref:uncharacterized protein n=1 Tax=Montipora capricornis TaxID=246305 RepID=UPI0035F1E554